MKQPIHFKDRIRQTFFRHAVILVLLPFLAFMLFSLSINSISLRNTCNTAADEIAAKIDSFYSEHRSFLEEIQSLESLHTVINGGDDFFMLNRDVGGFLRAEEYRRCFFVLAADGSLRYSNLREQEQSVLTFLKSRILVGILNANAGKMQQYTFYDALLDRSINIIAGAIMQDDVVAGYTGLILDNAEMRRILDHYKLNLAAVTDPYGNVVSYIGQLPIKNFMGKFNWSQPQNNYFIQQRTTTNELSVVVAIARETDQFMLRILFVVFFLLLITLLLMLKLLSNDLSKKLSRETESLVSAVGHLGDGDLDYLVPPGDSEEFTAIANQINHMSASLKDLIARNDELAALNRSAEVKQLEAQFNPHFLYNVLETVKVMAYLDPAKADSIIQHLSSLLRFSANQTRSTVTIFEDITHIKDYLFIQKSRFGDALQYSIDVDKQILSCMIPKLIIQPLVENSMKHGFLHSKSLCVTVCGRLDGDDVVLTVTDDGMLMSAETQAKVQDTIQSETPPEAHIGVFNINRRLVLLYGANYGLSMRTEGKNEFIVRLPARWDTGKEDANE